MIKKYISEWSICVFLAILPFIGEAQTGTSGRGKAVTHLQKNQIEQLPVYQPLSEYGSFIIRLDENTNLTEQEFLQNANAFFGLNEINTFQLIHSYTDKLGNVHKTYQHFVRSYPVEGQMFIVHQDKKGKVSTVNGTIINIENRNSSYGLREHVKDKITVSKEKAISIAFQANNIENSKGREYPVETVFIKSAKQKGLFVLAHKVRVDDFSEAQMYSKNVFVDVGKGEIIHEISLLAHANVQGRGDGFYRANLPLELQLVNGQYQMIDSERKLTTFDGEKSQNIWDVYKGIGTVYKHTTTNFPQSPAND